MGSEYIENFIQGCSCFTQCCISKANQLFTKLEYWCIRLTWLVAKTKSFKMQKGDWGDKDITVQASLLYWVTAANDVASRIIVLLFDSSLLVLYLLFDSSSSIGSSFQAIIYYSLLFASSSLALLFALCGTSYRTFCIRSFCVYRCQMFDLQFTWPQRYKPFIIHWISLLKGRTCPHRSIQTAFKVFPVNIESGVKTPLNVSNCFGLHSLWPWPGIVTFAWPEGHMNAQHNLIYTANSSVFSYNLKSFVIKIPCILTDIQQYLTEIL